jgi:protoheme IX farnesyltransferase
MIMSLDLTLPNELAELDLPGTELAPEQMARQYLSLTKPRIVLMVQITTLIGYLLGCRGEVDLLRLVELLLWSSACCAGVGVLNQYLERREDSLMRRTKKRPLPSGAIDPVIAMVFGLLLTISGCLMLWILINPLCGLISTATAVLYLAVYTPMKKISWWNTVIGAIPGALPPMGGWVAGSGQLDLGSVVLFLLLFCWQHPHFYSIAWIYKEDYERGGFVMLPSVDETGRKMSVQIAFFMTLLLCVSLLPLFYARCSIVYAPAAVALFYVYLKASVCFLRAKNTKNAYRLLRASVIYLPGILSVLLLTTW